MSTTPSDETRELIEAAKLGCLERVRAVMRVANCKHHGSKALRDAAKHGHLEVLRELLPHSDANSFNCDALVEAAALGRMDMIDLILPYINPATVQDQAVGEAIVYNHQDIFDTLIGTVVNDADGIEKLIMVAAQYGRGHMLETLLQHRGTTQHCDALKWAVQAQSAQCVELLLPHCDVASDHFVAWRWAFSPLSMDVVELLMPHVNVNMFGHFALVCTLLDGDINVPLARNLFEQSVRDTVLQDVEKKLNDEQSTPAHREKVLSLLHEWLNEEQNQRIHSTIETVKRSTIRRKL